MRERTPTHYPNRVPLPAEANAAFYRLSKRIFAVFFAGIMCAIMIFCIKEQLKELKTEQQTQTVMMKIIEKYIVPNKVKRKEIYTIRVEYKRHSYEIYTSAETYKSHKISDTIACKHIEGSDIALSTEARGAKNRLGIFIGLCVFFFIPFLFSDKVRKYW